MKSVGIAEAKARLSRYIQAVKAGEEVVLTERGRPVARLVPARGAGTESRDVDDLLRAGVLRPGRGPLPARFWKRAPTARDPSGSVLAGLLDERRSGS